MRHLTLPRLLRRLAGAASALVLLVAPSLFGAQPANVAAVAISPGSVDVSASAQTVVVTVTDTSASAMSASLTLAGAGSPTSSQTTGYVAGTTLSPGHFQISLTIPHQGAAGTWQLSLQATEGSGPLVQYPWGRLKQDFPPATVEVASSTADTAAPLLASFSLSPATIDTTSAGQAINASFSVTDNPSGTSSVSFWFTGPDGALYPGATALTLGTALSGTWGGAVTIPAGSVPGLYQLSKVTTLDTLNNSRTYLAADLASLGSPSVQNIGKLGQTITFGAIPDHTYGDAPFGLIASASSGLPVTLSIASGPATLSGNLLTITGAGYVTVRASQGGNSTYTAATDVERTFQVLKADATIVVTPYDVAYDGNAHTATGKATGLNDLDLGSLLTLSATTHTDAGTYATDAWTFAGDDNYNAASGTVSDRIAKVNAVITVTPYSVTYDGASHTATATAKGVESVPADLASLLTLSGTTHTDAGDYPADAWSFAGNTNYNPASGTVHDVIAKANAVITVTPYSVTYDGAAHTATATAKGVEAVPADLASLLTLSGTTHTNAGDYPADAWSFAGNTNYNAASGTVHDAIAKANAVITVTPYSVTYDGAAHTATATAKGVEAVPADLASLLTLSGTTHTNAGDYPADAWSFAGNTNYNAASGTVHDVIAKANAVITVTPYSAIYDGNPHTATATAKGVEAVPADLASLLTLSGTTHTDPGDYPADGWSFAGNINYNPASGTVHDAITYGFNGLLSPWNPSKSYKIKSAIPLKWQYTNASGAPVPSGSASPIISIVMVSAGDTGNADIALEDAGSSGYQYDSTTATWQFNWKTTGLAPGTYLISIKSGLTGQVNGTFAVILAR
ncbi:PxKF domain-containing protein [Geothrix paludis]|uniref:PxKF domain-containing protein n=1 Tax=Geothrix paludis TaxID=2922722 RepID=UPI001FADDC44|nr:PxKF domain-containing protein [Geothrix paludis]